MLAAYLDSSALVKLYVREDGSEAVEALYQALEVAACHEIGFVEVRAALARHSVLAAIPWRSMPVWSTTLSPTGRPA